MERKQTDYFRFTLLSILGIVLFFVPVIGGSAPIVWASGQFKALLGRWVVLLPVLSCLSLAVFVVLGKGLRLEPFRKYLEREGPVKVGFFFSTALLIILILLGVGPAPLQDPNVGGKVLELASTVMTTIILAGWGVVFILKSGVVEFVSILVEPVMRPLFRLPGEAAVNCLSSFVSSASVGVYFTEQYYLSKSYTQREACSVIVSFSVISVGYMGVLVSMAGIEGMYSQVILWSFILVLVMAMICVRIPPLSLKPEIYADGTPQTPAMRRPEKMTFSQRWRKALDAGAEKSREFTWKAFWGSLVSALCFAQKIIGVMITCVVLVLTLVHYTPLFQWLGKPIAPILALLGLPDAAKIAPSVLIGIVEVSLPSISIAGQGVAPQSAFFVVLLSVIQIIFFTEAGNAMLGSQVPIRLKDLLLTFVVRTALGIPLAALVSHLVF